MQNDPEQNQELNSAEQYHQARELAKQKRLEFDVTTDKVNIPLLRKISKHEGIKIDLREKIGTRIRAAYFFDEDGASILLAKKLPREPKTFALAHELKHHYLDRKDIASGKIKCGDYNANKTAEIAAEEFAAEFIYPILEMQQLIHSVGIRTGSCTAEQVVELKRRCPPTVSYTFIRKRLERLCIISKDQFSNVRFAKLEETLHPSLYKQDWFKRARARKKMNRIPF